LPIDLDARRTAWHRAASWPLSSSPSANTCFTQRGSGSSKDACRIASLDRQSQELLEEAANFAYSAWRAARSRRIHGIEFQEKNGYTHSHRSEAQRRKAFAVELQCLQNLSNATRDAGRFLDAAKLCYLLFRLFPDEFIKDSGFRSKLEPMLKIVPQYVFEVGLEVDPRFGPLVNKKSSLAKIERVVPLKGEAGSQEVVPPALPAVRRKFEDREPRHTFREKQPISPALSLRFMRDQETDAAWTPILAEIPRKENEPLPGYFLTVMHELVKPNKRYSADAMNGGFQIALKYGFIRTASTIVSLVIERGEFGFSKADILHLVHCVSKCSQLDPFGMRFERFLAWRNIICEALHSIWINKTSDDEWLTPGERLRVHETLIGRTHTHHRSLNFDYACRLYHKATGAYEVEDLRKFYDYSYDFMRSARGIANSKTVAEFCRSHRNSALGAPVAMSVLRVADLVSIVAIGQNGIAHQKDLVLPDLEEQAKELGKQSEFWFKDAKAPFQSKIEWPESFRQIGAAIVRLARQTDCEARVIMLSLDAYLASFPWQHLVCSRARSHAGIARGTEHLVALVPSLGTMMVTKDSDDYFESGIVAHLGDETDEIVGEVSRTVQASIRRYAGGSSSACILVGHGRPGTGDSRMPTVRLGARGELSSAEDWMSILNHKHIVLHCCHAGRANAVFMRELGGIPGLAINLGVDIFCAPVTEVGKSAAQSLQLNLFADAEGRDFGLGYLAAIAQNSAVCLYNIYGSPYSQMIPKQQYSQMIRKQQFGQAA
jgi:hypothetical protein